MMYTNRAISTNLHRRPLKLGRLIVLKETHQWLQKFRSHGNSLFSSPHLLYFNLLVIFSTKNINWCHKLELTYLYACCIIHTRHISKYQNGMPKVTRKAFNIGEIWNLVCCHGNKTVEFVLWSTFSRILLQRTKHFWYKLAEISFFIVFDQNLVECMTLSID